jgi:hypothetical protein
MISERSIGPLDQSAPSARHNTRSDAPMWTLGQLAAATTPEPVVATSPDAGIAPRARTSSWSASVRPSATTAWEGAAKRVMRTLSERCRDELNAATERVDVAAAAWDGDGGSRLSG